VLGCHRPENALVALDYTYYYLTRVGEITFSAQYVAIKMFVLYSCFWVKSIPLYF
jgi:hypothetical protein